MAQKEKEQNNVVTYEDLFEQLSDYRKRAEEGGGQKRIDAQHGKNKLTARERIALLVDPGTFEEVYAFMEQRFTDFGLDKAKYPGDGMVIGFAKVNGRRVALFSQDFTVLGGSFSEVAGLKFEKISKLAMDAGVPLVGINDGGGARIQEGTYSLEAFGRVFYANTLASGVIPQISVQVGPSAGGAVYSPGLTDFVVMTEGISYMFITGPQVIKTVTGEDVDFETLGGAAAHASVSGVAHFATPNEEASFQVVKDLLSYLPSNNTEAAPSIAPTDDPNRMDTDLDTIVPLDPNTPYDIKDVIAKVFDLNSFFEVHASFARNAVVGFARLHGQVVGVVGQQPSYMAGVLDIDASDKIARFVRFSDAFNIPLVTFSDSPGYLPGTNQEHGGIIRHGAKILYSYSEATVPKLTVIPRKGYGGAMISMCSKFLGADMVFAWPTAEVAVMGAAGAVSILYRKEMKAAEDKAKFQADKVAEIREKFANPYAAARAGHIDAVIMPSETRPKLIAALELLRDKQASLPAKKHGNIPL